MSQEIKMHALGKYTVQECVIDDAGGGIEKILEDNCDGTPIGDINLIISVLCRISKQLESIDGKLCKKRRK